MNSCFVVVLLSSSAWHGNTDNFSLIVYRPT